MQRPGGWDGWGHICVFEELKGSQCSWGALSSGERDAGLVLEGGQGEGI